MLNQNNHKKNSINLFLNANIDKYDHIDTYIHH